MTINYVNQNEAKRLTDLMFALLSVRNLYEKYWIASQVNSQEVARINTLIAALNNQPDFSKLADTKGYQRDFNRYSELKQIYELLREDKVNIMSIDFKTLKRNVLPLVMADRFLDNKLGITVSKVESIFQTLSGTLDDVINIKKRAEESGCEKYLWVHPRPNANPNPAANRTYQADQPYTEYYDYETSIFDNIMDYLNVLIQKIPRNNKDYENIIETYERLIERYEKEVVEKKSAIEDIDRKLEDAKKKREDAKTPLNLQFASEKERANLRFHYSQLNGEINKQLNILQQKASEVNASSEQFQALYTQKIDELNAKSSLLQSFSKMSARTLNIKYRGTRLTNAEMRDKIYAELRQFPDYQAVWNWTINQILQQNFFNRQIMKKIDKFRREQASIQAQLDSYRQNPKVLEDLIVSRIEADYQKEVEQLNRQRRKIYSKQAKREASLRRAQDNYRSFLEEYQSIYEPRSRKPR